MACTQIACFPGPSQPWLKTLRRTSPAILHTSARRVWRDDASGSPGSSAPCSHGVKWDTKKPAAPQHQDEGRLSKEMLLHPGWRRSSGATSSGSPGMGPNVEPPRSLLQPSGKMTARDIVLVPSPALRSLLDKSISVIVDKWIRVRALPTAGS